MIRPFACLLLGLPLVAHADVRSEIAAKYRQLDQAVARKDVRAVSDWIRVNTTADFSYTSKDKNRYRRAAFEKGLRDQIGITRKVNSAKTQVTSIKIKGSVATLGVDSDTDAIVVFDTRPMKLVDKSHTVDTWVKAGNAWLLKRSLQTKSDTQMFQQ